MPPELPMPDVINFDLDGTILNVESRFRRALNAARAIEGLSPMEVADFHVRYRSGGLSSDVRPERIEPFWRTFLDRFCFDPGETLGEPYPGVFDALGRIRAAGIRTAIITNRSAPSDHVAEELDRLGIRGHFDLVLSQGSFNFRQAGGSWCKSSMILHAAESFAVGPHRMAMVGDLSVDITSARTAGCGWAVAVRSGGSPAHELERVGPDAIVDSVADLVDHFGL